MTIDMWGAYRSCETCDVAWFGIATCWACGTREPQRIKRVAAPPPMQNPSTWHGNDPQNTTRSAA